MTVKSFLCRSLDFVYRRIIYVYYRICKALPIDNNLIVFYSSVDYSDSSRVFYEYLLEKRPNYRYVWMLNGSGKLYNKERTEFLRMFGSPRAAKQLAVAKYVFHTHPLDALFDPRDEQLVVNLWHGIPFKGKKGKIPPKNKKTKFNIMLCLGDNNIATTASFVGCDQSLLRPWGYPRLDLLYTCKDIGKNNPFVPDGFNGKLILWMPTFRKSIAKHLSEQTCDNETGLPLLTSISEINRFNDYLKSFNVVIIIKIHHLQAKKDIFGQRFSHLVFLQDKEILSKGYQLYEIVAKSDALLTDYSSIFADYLLMDRPIGFILDDLKEYETSRGAFLFNPITDVLCGNHIYHYDELCEFCSEIGNVIDKESEFRKRIKTEMINYPDGNNCQRLIDKLGM